MSAIRLLPAALTYATGTLTLTGNAADTETVVIAGRTYTFQTVLTNVDGNVLIGATASDSLDNLIAAINLAAGAGTTYAAATTANTSVTAAAGAGDTMVVTAIVEGPAGGLITTTETVTGTWAAAKLTGSGATASAAPTLTDATAGKAVPYLTDQGLLLLRNVDAAAGTTKTVVGGVLWGFSPVTSRWYKIGAINSGVDLAETTSDAINFCELIVGLRRFSRLHFQFTSLGGAGTEIEVYVDCVPANLASD